MVRRAFLTLSALNIGHKIERARVHLRKLSACVAFVAKLCAT